MANEIHYSSCVRKVEQRDGLFADEFAQRQALDPVLWDSGDAVVGPRELTVDRASGVGIDGRYSYSRPGSASL